MQRIVTLTLNPALDLSTQADHVIPGEKTRCGEPRRDPGGGGVNVSRAIRFLGGESVAVMAAGGESGAALMGLLQAEGLEARNLGLPLPTRESLSVRDESTGNQYRFVMPGPRWKQEHIDRTMEVMAGLVSPGDLVVPSGSFPPGVPPAFLVELSNVLEAKNAHMVLDTSGEALEVAASARVGIHVLRMDGFEARQLSGRPLESLEEIAEFGQELKSQNSARTVFISDGANGTVLVNGRGHWHCRPPTVDVLSATGAGDSFVAGMVLALARGLDPVGACVAGTGAAAAAVTTPGTALCERETADELASQVIVQRL